MFNELGKRGSILAITLLLLMGFAILSFNFVSVTKGVSSASVALEKRYKKEVKKELKTDEITIWDLIQMFEDTMETHSLFPYSQFPNLYNKIWMYPNRSDAYNNIILPFKIITNLKVYKNHVISYMDFCFEEPDDPDVTNSNYRIDRNFKIRFFDKNGRLICKDKFKVAIDNNHFPEILNYGCVTGNITDPQHYRYNQLSSPYINNVSGEVRVDSQAQDGKHYTPFPIYPSKLFYPYPNNFYYRRALIYFPNFFKRYTGNNISGYHIRKLPGSYYSTNIDNYLQIASTKEVIYASDRSVYFSLDSLYKNPNRSPFDITIIARHITVKINPFKLGKNWKMRPKDRLNLIAYGVVLIQVERYAPTNVNEFRYSLNGFNMSTDMFIDNSLSGNRDVYVTFNGFSGFERWIYFRYGNLEHIHLNFKKDPKYVFDNGESGAFPYLKFFPLIPCKYVRYSREKGPNYQ